MGMPRAPHDATGQKRSRRCKNNDPLKSYKKVDGKRLVIKSYVRKRYLPIFFLKKKKEYGHSVREGHWYSTCTHVTPSL